MKTRLALICCLLLPAASRAANITGTGASVHDSAGAARSTFSNSETITLRQSVNIAENSPTSDSVDFTFEILNAAGAAVFTHAGNSAPGTQGGAQTQLAGISINSFYSSPGNYTFRAKATLDAETVTQTAAFLISSPNITLIYPPNGARGLSDNPLTFRWTASGASRYRVTVADNASLYNELHSAVNAGESYYSYPADPSEPRERLVPEQVYYWKVEGLDASNNKISESNVYTFSLKGQASSTTRNVAVTLLEVTTPALDFEKPINFKAVLYNSGSATESNISVKMSLGGLSAQDSPKPVMTIGPGEQVALTFTAFMPPGQEQGLAAACADLFDDNMPDNCKTRLIGKDAGTTTAAGAGRKLTYDEMFQAILQRLGPEAAKALEGYTFESLSCANCSQDELALIIAALISGEAQLIGASVTETGGAETTLGANTSAAADAGSDSAGEEAVPEETSLDLSPLKNDIPGEWSGYTEARGKEASTIVIRSKKEWRKLWQTLSNEEEPDVDFGDSMVIGVISGALDRAAAVRLLGSRKTDDGIAFDYYQIETPRGAEASKAAYIFRLYPRSDDKVSFSRVDVRK
ncbi:MAG: hypothetical protein A2X29_08065 [Elusimicrobia bacterium GWA2_64_40]|nr:MAG: hypothetical protein A2X29_08065 [Elusimicrobia bacterium GWA2_64_40]HAN03766.1 hypothetical protein [Elusimicrobiota bacterium]